MRAASSGVRSPSSGKRQRRRNRRERTRRTSSPRIIRAARRPAPVDERRSLRRVRRWLAGRRRRARRSRRAAAARTRRPSTTSDPADEPRADDHHVDDRKPTSTTPTTDARRPISRTCASTLTPVVSGLEQPGRARVARARHAHVRRRARRARPRRRRRRDAVARRRSSTIGPLSHGNEQGLLGITFSPDGSKLYVDYTDPDDDTHVDEYTMQGDVAVASTPPRRCSFVDQPYSNHNGGEVIIGPDGMLYIGLGDGGSEGDPNTTGRTSARCSSKILRIDPAATGGAPYSVPADNPFVGRAGARPETWMWGLRNPWRFSFDRATGDMWIGDVGQDDYEEIDFAPAGEHGHQLGLERARGLPRVPRRRRPAGARDPIARDDARRRATARSSAATCTAGRRSPRSTASTSSATTADIQDRRRRRSRAARSSRSATSARPSPQLTTFGEDPDGRGLRGDAQRNGVPLHRGARPGSLRRSARFMHRPR